MKAYTSAEATTPVALADRESTCHSSYAKLMPCTEHNMENNVCTYCGFTIYLVTYNGNNATGGTVPTDANEYPSGQTVTVLGNTGDLVRTGYTFGGWNTQADGFGTDYAADATFTISSSVTLYAKWTPITYTITCDLAGGTVATANPTSYTVESAAITLNNPTREGYTFAGWTGTGLTEPTTTVTIAHGSTGDREYTATWTPITYTIAYDNDYNIEAAASDGMYYDVTLAGRTLYKDGDWNTLCLPFDVDDFTGTPLEGATVKTLESSSFSGGTLTMTFSDDLASIEAGVPYIVKYGADLFIRDVDDWNAFASNVTNGTETYEGKTVKLAADISVTTMVGSSSNRFKGTFDGCGHTLTFNYTSTAQYCAPFRYTDGATFKNLKVAGTITTSKDDAAGITAHSNNGCTIQNCQVSISISSTFNGGAADGGFIALNNSGNATITNCLFDGKLLGTSTNKSYYVCSRKHQAADRR